MMNDYLRNTISIKEKKSGDSDKNLSGFLPILSYFYL